MTEPSIFNETFDEVRSGHFRSLTDALRVHTTDFYKYF